MVQIPEKGENTHTVCRGADAGPGADEQGEAELSLHTLDDVAQAGLGVSQLFGGPGQVAQVDGGEQRGAFVVIHGSSFP